MLLAFDVGNTNIVVGIFEGKKLIQNWRLSTDKNKSSDEYGMLLKELFDFEGLSMNDVEDVIISTVAPTVSFTLQHLVFKYFKKSAFIIGEDVDIGMAIKYDDPKQVGADRLVNAVAAREKYGVPLIIVDFGTATTFCGISQEGDYLGGAIAPGIKIAGEALFEKTAKLPRIELDPPDQIMCKNTVESMQSGLIYGHMGMVSYIISKMKEEIGCDPDKKINIVATGGMATMIAEGVPEIECVDRYLTLEGLQIIYERNCNNVRKDDYKWLSKI